MSLWHSKDPGWRCGMAVLSLDEVKSVHEELDSYLELDEGWDGQDALPIRGQTVSLAKSFVDEVALRAKNPDSGHEAVRWEEPSISPGPNGEICIAWGQAERRVSIVLSGDQPSVLTCVLREAGRPPRMEAAIRCDAIEHALWALRV